MQKKPKAKGKKKGKKQKGKKKKENKKRKQKKTKNGKNKKSASVEGWLFLLNLFNAFVKTALSLFMP